MWLFSVVFAFLLSLPAHPLIMASFSFKSLNILLIIVLMLLCAFQQLPHLWLFLLTVFYPSFSHIFRLLDISNKFLSYGQLYGCSIVRVWLILSFFKECRILWWISLILLKLDFRHFRMSLDSPYCGARAALLKAKYF